MVHKTILIPDSLKPGDAVAIAAISGPPDPELLPIGTAFLNKRGFRTVVTPCACESGGYLAGPDEQRCGNFNSLISDREVRGIFLARGGYGSMRILDDIDLESVVRNPKVILGMSDVTALQLSLYKSCGLATFSGPMIAGQVAMGVDSMTEAYLLEAITTDQKAINFWPGAHPVRVVREGRVTGAILGGCLSMITALMGTPHLPDFTGSILLLEDLNEPPYKLDRMLTQLRLGGILEAAAGIILAHFIGVNGEDLSEVAADLVSAMTRKSSKPIISGFPHGHALPNVTLPHGRIMELDTRSKSLVLA
jgi:muramoyltetrapeptide carboxypeptidase